MARTGNALGNALGNAYWEASLGQGQKPAQAATLPGGRGRADVRLHRGAVRWAALGCTGLGGAGPSLCPPRAAAPAPTLPSPARTWRSAGARPPHAPYCLLPPCRRRA